MGYCVFASLPLIVRIRQSGICVTSPDAQLNATVITVKSAQSTATRTQSYLQYPKYSTPHTVTHLVLGSCRSNYRRVWRGERRRGDLVAQRRAPPTISDSLRKRNAKDTRNLRNYSIQNTVRYYTCSTLFIDESVQTSAHHPLAHHTIVLQVRVGRLNVPCVSGWDRR